MYLVVHSNLEKMFKIQCIEETCVLSTDIVLTALCAYYILKRSNLVIEFRMYSIDQNVILRTS